MTQDEAEAIARVICTADSGCTTCVNNLCEKLTAANLGFVWKMEGPDFLIQPDWSDDPDDAKEYPGITVTPT